MEIAIVGAGFSGIATCWHLLQAFPEATVTLFDKGGIGFEASGIAAGLLHPFAGAHAKLNKDGLEGMQATKELLYVAKMHIDQSIWQEKGILRVAVSEEQKKDFKQTAEKYPEQVKWLNAEETKRWIKEIQHPSLLIPSGIVVNCSLYLQGLWKACEKKGAFFQKIELLNLQSLTEFDRIIIAAGANALKFPELAHLPLSLVKGQLLEFLWEDRFPHLTLPISSTIYIVMHPTGSSFFAGATYERHFKDSNADLDTAVSHIIPKIKKILPILSEAQIIGCQSGIRVSTPDHLPKFGAINERIWYLTGMGSKGLLYHGLYAKKLIHQMMQSI